MTDKENNTMEYIMKMRGLFSAIELLGHECGDQAQGEIVALAEIGTSFADLLIWPANNGESEVRHG
jgi:hypothetical protein